MSDIEQKALALLKECVGNAVWKHPITQINRETNLTHEALCRAIEQHEAFRQEVSDAVEHFKRCYPGYQHASLFDRFIITKPDPLVEVLDKMLRRRTLDPAPDVVADEAAWLRAALAERGLEIREKSE